MPCPAGPLPFTASLTFDIFHERPDVKLHSKAWAIARDLSSISFVRFGGLQELDQVKLDVVHTSSFDTNYGTYECGIIRGTPLLLRDAPRKARYLD